MNKKIASSAFVICALIMCNLAMGQQEEKLTITTYYPSPTGVYNKLLTETLGVGDTDGSGTLNFQDAPDPATQRGQL